MMNRLLVLACTFAATLGPLTVADDGDLAGPIWGEGSTDKAGTSPATALRTKTVAASDSSGGTVTSISGSTGTTSLVGALPDSVDLYEIYVSSPTQFDVTSSVYTVTSRGRAASTGAEVEIEVVIDKSELPAKILSYREQ